MTEALKIPAHQPTRVGTMLKEEFLAPLGITQGELAKSMGVGPATHPAAASWPHYLPARPCAVRKPEQVSASTGRRSRRDEHSPASLPRTGAPCHAILAPAGSARQGALKRRRAR